jgi:putative ABC transport system permease protein
MGTILQDLRYAVRMLVKQPGFTCVAVLTLALGIGANSAIFSVVNAVLLRPLPFKDQDQIVKIWETFTPTGSTRSWSGSASVPNLKDWREQNDVFTEIAYYQSGSFNLQDQDQPQRVQSATVSTNLFDVLGVLPRLGRTFVEGEDQQGNHRVVVLSDRLWRNNFAADSAIVGTDILLGGENFTVVGVMPAGFQFPSRSTDLWVPYVLTPNQISSRHDHFLMTIARLRPDAAFELAQEQMRTIAARLEQQYPDNQTNRSIKLIRLHEEMVQRVRPALLMLLGAVGFVLLIACTNVANLLLARATSRRREIAIRTALGAGRARIVRQLLTESVLLAFVGGGLGLLLARFGVDALMRLASTILPRSDGVGLDGRVVVFTLALSIVTGLIFGLAPAIQVSRTNVQESLKEGGASAGGAQRNWLRNLLVVAETASALVLLIGAALLIRSFAQLQQTDSGLRPENVLTMRLSLSDTKYSTDQSAQNFYEQLLGRVSGLAGVEAAGLINYLPLQQWGHNGDIGIEGKGPFLPGQAPLAEYRAASPDYFRALGVPLVAGRYFNEQDRQNSTPVVIINQTLARRYLPDEDPVGKRLRLFDPDWRTIVGVVGDVKQAGLTRAIIPETFMPYTQAPAGFIGGMSLVVRAASDPGVLTPAIRGEVLSLDPAQPIYQVETMESVIAASVSDRRLNMLLLGIFASVALVLALVGIYSVMSYTVTQSTREIGIRMALGARPRDVMRLVVGQGLVLTSIGVGIGVGAAFALTRVMESLLFEVKATDPVAFTAVSAALVVVALIACYIPARRATKVDPIVALRYE